MAGNTEREVLSSEWESENSELRTYNSKLGEAGDSELKTFELRRAYFQQRSEKNER